MCTAVSIVQFTLFWGDTMVFSLQLSLYYNWRVTLTTNGCRHWWVDIAFVKHSSKPADLHLPLILLKPGVLLQDKISNSKCQIERNACEMKWNKQTLEAWLINVEKKDSDVLVIEKYSRQDEATIKVSHVTDMCSHNCVLTGVSCYFNWIKDSIWVEWKRFLDVTS